MHQPSLLQSFKKKNRKEKLKARLMMDVYMFYTNNWSDIITSLTTQTNAYITLPVPIN
jgi:hypothetical protein